MESKNLCRCFVDAKEVVDLEYMFDAILAVGHENRRKSDAIQAAADAF